MDLKQNKFSIFLEMIKWKHTVFALPFAYLGAFWAVRGVPRFDQLLWITVAMVGARTFAMSANRLIDWKIDAKNPRTKSRAIPAGLLTPNEVTFYMAASLVIMLIAVYNLSTLAKVVWPFVVITLLVYPYMKRFFSFANMWLGLCLALVPISAWMAVKNSVSLTIVFVSLGVFCWASGFDIIYACQDYEVDVREKLHSVPVCFGIKKALLTTKSLHFFSVLFFALAGYTSHFHPIYFIGLFFGNALLLYENLIISENDLSRLNEAFFTANSFFSVIVAVFALIAIFV